MKTKILLFNLIACLNLYCQVNDGQSNIIKTDLINYPQAPETSKLSGYSDISIDNFSGQISHSIPIFSIEDVDYQHKINLSYQYSGLRTEESPSVYGYSWFMNLNGAVTRSVRGLPDETNFGFFGYGLQQIKENIIYPIVENEISNLNTANIDYFTAINFENGTWDTERDKYTVNFNGINFSFTFTDEGTPYYLSSHNFKIEMQFSDSNRKIVEKFILHDNSGNEYHFSHKERLQPIARFDQVFNDSFQEYTTSWLIEKIILSNNNQIIFNYIDNDYESVSFSANFLMPTNQFSETTVIAGFPAQDAYNDFILPKYVEKTQRDILKRKLVSEIIFPKGRINIDYTEFNNFKVVNNLMVKDIHGVEKISYLFEYVGVRNLLKSIIKNSEKFQSFDYFQESASIRFITEPSDITLAKSTDEYGYYNGIDNSHFIGAGSNNVFADKTPNFNTTKIFALEKIKYSTGGYTEIKYEQNTTICENDSDNCFAKPNISVNLKFKTDGLQNFNGVYSKQKSIQLTFETPTICELRHTAQSYQNAHIHLEVNKVNGNSSLYYQDEIPYLRTVQQTEIPLVQNLYLAQTLDDNHSPGQPYIVSHHSQGYFKISPGTYNFSISTIQNHKDASGEIIFKYYRDLFPNVKQNNLTAGIRVKEITNYENEDFQSTFTKKYFDYNDDEGYSNGRIIQESLKKNALTYKLRFLVTSVSGGQPMTSLANAATLAYDYYFRTINDDLINNVPVYYRKIRTAEEIISQFNYQHLSIPSGANTWGLNWDNTKSYNYIPSPEYPTYGQYTKVFPRGYIEKEYINPFINIQNTLPIIPSPDTNNRSLVKKSTIVKESSSGYIPQIVNEYTYNAYSINPPGQQISTNYPRMKNFKVGKKVKFHNDTPAGGSSVYNDLDDLLNVKFYWDHDINLRLIHELNNEFFGNNPITINNDYIYDSRNYLSEKITNFNDGNLKSEKYFRSYNFSDAVSQQMTNNRVFDKILKFEDDLNDVNIKTVELTHENLTNKLYLPTKIKEFKNNSFNPLLNYKYSPKGLPVEVKSINEDDTIIGGLTCIIYGYNQSLPVAKIENMAFNSIPTSLRINVQSANSEESLIEALIALRDGIASSEVLVTTYTHIPMVGIKTITDPKGHTMTYDYDDFNRLEKVTDMEGNILSENQYHYRTQN